MNPSKPHWSSRAPMSLLDEGMNAHGEPDSTPLDRRWLWRLENFLAVNGTNDGHRLMGSDLREYLYETCEHQWQAYAAEPGIDRHRQCTWCKDVEWLDEAVAVDA